MEIREIREEELDAAIYIGRQAFAHGSRGGTSWLRDPKRPPMTLLGLWDDDGMQARLFIANFQAHFGPQAILGMGGIGGVACLPAGRGKGYAGALLIAALERMRADGQTISTLFPFNWDFYRRFGWEWVGLQRSYTAPTTVLKPHPETASVRAARQADWPALTACYTRFAQRYRGMLARSQKQWEDEFADTEEYFTSTYYYARDGAVEGYLVYSEGKEEKTELQEFIALTPEAQAALLGLLRRQEMQTRKFAWAAPEEDPLFFTLCHTDVETKLAPVTQGRVVDVPGALAAWRPQTSARGAVTVAIQDECAPWNAGTWRIEAEDGQISCRRTDAEAQVSLDIQAFSQAFFGTPTVDTIRAANRLTVHDEAGFTALRALFDGPPMWMNDHF